MRTHPIRGMHAQKAVSAQMRTHSKLLCIRGSIFRLRARGHRDSRILLVTAGYSWESGAESRTPSNTCSNPARDKVLSELQRTKASPPERACHVFGAVVGEAEYLSHSSPGSLLFDPEIERTLRRTRQAKRRAELARLALNNNRSSDSSSDSDTQSSYSVSGTSTMTERLTLKQPGEDPIKHIKDFEVICATTRRTGGDDDAVKAFALPFSLDDRAKGWYHTLPADPLSNPKEGLNALNDKLESEEEAATTNDKDVVQQLCEMLIEREDTGEIFDSNEEFDSDYKKEEFGEGKLAEGWGSDTETQNLQGKMLSINTSSEEELPMLGHLQN
ncbi:hypothetical protein PIB30_002025 [Stylosanthes scabra]|uniref:Uncharacterized protein n=1 Tax=Stylosanthes scabra TaxID=79078 RepID=A0ABU6Q2P6_9FABA|nr:hypothetical protein [Stylosanthes scabra]